jgi:transposase
MMIKVIFYSYSKGIISSLRIQKEMEQNIYYRFLSGRQRPDLRTLANFSSKHISDVEKIFNDGVKLCLSPGMAEKGTISIYGNKLRSNANRDKFRDVKWLSNKIEIEKKAIRKLRDSGILFMKCV